MADANHVTNKIRRLTKYLEDMKGKLSIPVPPRHKKSPENYLDWVRLEIRRTEMTLNTLR